VGMDCLFFPVNMFSPSNAILCEPWVLFKIASVLYIVVSPLAFSFLIMGVILGALRVEFNWWKNCNNNHFIFTISWQIFYHFHWMEFGKKMGNRWQDVTMAQDKKLLAFSFYNSSCYSGASCFIYWSMCYLFIFILFIRTLPSISREEFELIFDELDDSHDFKVYSLVFKQNTGDLLFSPSSWKCYAYKQNNTKTLF